jgi:hypothetical protein
MAGRWIELVVGILFFLVGGVRAVTAGTNTPRTGLLGSLLGPRRSPAVDLPRSIGECLFGAALLIRFAIPSRDLGDWVALPVGGVGVALLLTSVFLAQRQ